MITMHPQDTGVVIAQQPTSTTPPHQDGVFSFHLSEIALYQCTSTSYKPFRAKLCNALCKAFDIKVEYSPKILASRTDLGQFHADNYLGMLQVTSELWAYDDDRQAKRAKSEDELVKEKLNVFQLGTPSDEENAVFPGMYAYLRLIATGSLAGAQELVEGRRRIAVNWYGGHARSRKACAVGGCFVNDSVLATLALHLVYRQALHISFDLHHAVGVEEAFYTSRDVFTVSFHSSKSTTGHEDDAGYGAGVNTNLNFPLDPGAFTDEIFVKFFGSQLMKIKAAFNPQVVICVCSPSVLAGTEDDDLNMSLKGYLQIIDIVSALGLPTLLLGGPARQMDVAAKAWCAATAKLQGIDLIGKTIPEDCEFREHFSLDQYVLDVPARKLANGDTNSLQDKLSKLDAKATSRLSALYNGQTM